MSDARAAAMEAARNAMLVEADAIRKSIDVVVPALGDAVDVISKAPGRVIVSGLGKSGLIGAKIAATLSSVGTPAQFIHAGEALHGDSGAIVDGDVAILISFSGETTEVCALAEILNTRDIPVIAMSSDPNTTLGRLAEIHLDIAVATEADPLGLAPTTSTTVTLAVGDALAVALMTVAEFTAEDFAVRHPGGSLGDRLRDVGGGS